MLCLGHMRFSNMPYVVWKCFGLFYVPGIEPSAFKRCSGSDTDQRNQGVVGDGMRQAEGRRTDCLHAHGFAAKAGGPAQVHMPQRAPASWRSPTLHREASALHMDRTLPARHAHGVGIRRCQCVHWVLLQCSRTRLCQCRCFRAFPCNRRRCDAKLC